MIKSNTHLFLLFFFFSTTTCMDDSHAIPDDYWRRTFLYKADELTFFCKMRAVCKKFGQICDGIEQTQKKYILTCNEKAKCKSNEFKIFFESENEKQHKNQDLQFLFTHMCKGFKIDPTYENIKKNFLNPSIIPSAQDSIVTARIIAYRKHTKDSISTKIMEACKNSKYVMVKAYLEHKDNIKKIFLEQFLFVACKNKDIKIIKLLLKNGTDINFQDECGDTILHEISWDYEPLITLLIKAGVKMDIKNNGEQTVWDVTAHAYSLALEILLKHFDINTKDKNGDTALLKAVNDQNEDMITSLIKLGADVNIQNNNGESPLMIAVRKGFFEIAQFLINTGANLFVIDNCKNTILHKAVEHENIAFIENLLHKNLNVNAKNKNGATPLMLTMTTKPMQIVKAKQNDIAKLFIEHDADVNITCEDNQDVPKNTILHIATPGDTILHMAIRTGNIELIKIILDSKQCTTINATNNDGYTPLMLAIKRGNCDMTALLIDYGADVNAVCNNQNNSSYKDTILHMAVKKGNIKLIQILLNSKKCIIDAKDKYGNTPLAMAIQKKQHDIAELLAKHGTETNNKNS